MVPIFFSLKKVFNKLNHKLYIKKEDFCLSCIFLGEYITIHRCQIIPNLVYVAIIK